MNYKYNIPNGEYYSNPFNSQNKIALHTTKYKNNSTKGKNRILNSYNSRNIDYQNNTNNYSKNIINSDYNSLNKDNSILSKYNITRFKNDRTSSSDMVNLKKKFNSVNQKIERLNQMLNTLDTYTSRNINNNYEKRPNSSNRINKIPNNILTNSNYKHYSNFINSPISSIDYKINYSSYQSPILKNVNYNNNNNYQNYQNSLTTKDSTNYIYSPKSNYTPIKQTSLRYNNSSQSNNITFKNNSFGNLNKEKNIVNKQENSFISPIKNNIYYNNNNYNLINKTKKYINENNNSKNLKNGNINTDFHYSNLNNKKIHYERVKNYVIPKDSNLNKMIQNLHEKRKILIDGEEDGLERYRKLKLNQKLNNFNKNLITGHWSHIKNSFDGNDHSNFFNEYKKNNVGIKVYHSPIQMNKNKSDNNLTIKNTENNNKKDSKSNYKIDISEIRDMLDLLNEQKNNTKDNPLVIKDYENKKIPKKKEENEYQKEYINYKKDLNNIKVNQNFI